MRIFRALFLFGSLALFASCLSHPRQMNSIDRAPTEAATLKTREGLTFSVPALKTNLNIPSCEAPGVDTNSECIPANEAELFNEITNVSMLFQSVQNPKGVEVSQRDFHALHHACLAGKWTPLPNIPAELKVGVFAQTNQLNTVIRYSNGSPKNPRTKELVPPDAKPDGRGLAIKLVGVMGESIIDVEDVEPGFANQDFVLINNASFFLRSPKSYPVFLSSLAKGETLPNGLPKFLAHMDPGELAVLKATNTVVPDVAAERFFSQTPYVLGNGYAKYSVRPCHLEKTEPLTEKEIQNPRFLRERIRSRLAKSPICLIFSVQKKTPAMKVEDATVVWNESDSSFVDVARIDIPSNQDLNSADRDSYCENISFNPWNSLAPNRPAGAINRARLEVYSAISRKRRLENRVPIREPKKDEAFFKLKDI